ncbi:terminase large subunit [Micromonospora sp. WMMC241]|uniref:terminase large subunit n=1 Tax=Micromonospora sp. WMMC241 TaxID=3015159 RepID=UPI0022B738A5|nr:terminase large subunit [Micromonospora sp. WMMC241]MCZ7434773.1 terminase large subunit [Micromonospora sp. WMMC241]MCZ7440828.1 terminase large subunit [Micromonospora sp. WMMC241]MCZ7440917.1 terminase large subunit [Micromonospora sp. WMMC241]
MEFAEEVLGFHLMPWQRWLLIHSLELLADGRFRFRTVLVLVARQNGKTTLVEVKNLWKMFVLRIPLVIGTAQNLDVSEESWDKAVEIVESVPELAAEVPRDGGIVRVNGKKSLKLAHGSRWKVAAASRKGGRGLSGDDVNLDELREHHTWESWAAVTKTTMARRKAQIWAFSNAGDDRSVVLNALQEKGRATAEDPAADASMGIFEWSAPDDCPVDDPQMWRLANPSLGYPQGISFEALRAALETDPEPIFRTECLCQRVPDLEPSKIPLTAWVKCADPSSRIVGPVVLAWEVSWHRDRAAIAAAGLRADGLPHVELVEYRDGTDWVAGRLGEIAGRQPVTAVLVDPSGPGGSLLSEVTERLPARLDPTPLTMRGLAHACGRLYDAALTGQLRQLGDDRLLEMLRKSSTRQLADAWAWDRKHSGGDISGLVAVTAALHGLGTAEKPQPPAAPVITETLTVRSETNELASAGF